MTIKLTPDAVRTIIHRYYREFDPVRELSHDYGVTVQQIYNILKRHSWKHLTLMGPKLTKSTRTTVDTILNNL